MTTAADLGFVTPTGDELVNTGDNAITQNANASAQMYDALRADSSAKANVAVTMAQAATATSGTALSIANSASDDATNAVDRVESLESAAGFGPSTPTDGTMANFIANPASLTSGALSAAIDGYATLSTDPLGHFKAGVARGLAGGGAAHVAVYSDSIGQGYYATTPFYTNAWAAVLKTAVETQTGITAGTGVVPVYEAKGPNNGEDRFTVPWANKVGLGFMGRCYFADKSFAPITVNAITCDSFTVHYLTATNGGSFTITVDGSKSYVVDDKADAPQYRRVTIPLTPGSHSFSVSTAAAANFSNSYVLGWEAGQNSAHGVKVSRVALSSMETSTLIGPGAGGSLESSIHGLAPDLAVVSFGTNEWFNGTTPTVYEANLRTAVNAFHGVGSDVLLVIPPTPAGAKTYPWTDYVTKINTIADDLGCVVVDGGAALNGHDPANFNDSLHPSNAGHALLGAAVHDAIAEALDVAPSRFMRIDELDKAVAGLFAAQTESFVAASRKFLPAPPGNTGLDFAPGSTSIPIGGDAVHVTPTKVSIKRDLTLGSSEAASTVIDLIAALGGTTLVNFHEGNVPKWSVYNPGGTFTLRDQVNGRRMAGFFPGSTPQNSYALFESNLQVKGGAGFNGKDVVITPPTVASAATDQASTMTLVNQLRAALVAVGLVV